VILGAVLACSASLLYNVGLAVQALDAREAPADESLRPALLLRLVRRPRRLAGTGLKLLGWPLQALALGLAPLAVVQPSLAFGLLALLAIGARTPGVRVGRRDVGATLAILAGVVVVAAVSGAASHDRAPASSWRSCWARWTPSRSVCSSPRAARSWRSAPPATSRRPSSARRHRPRTGAHPSGP
jgi:hypothetical protein